MKKRSIISVLVIAGMVCLGGCSIMTGDFGSSEGKRLKERGDAAIAYLEEKYGEEFTPITYGLSDYLSDVDVVECYPSWMDPEQEYVSIFLHSDGTYGDNYYEYLKREEIEEYIKNFFCPAFGDEIKVYLSCSKSEMPAELNRDSTVEDFLQQKPEYTFVASVFVNGNDTIPEIEFEQKMADIEENLYKTGRAYILNLYVVDPSAYERIARHETSSVTDIYKEKWEPDGKVIKNAHEVMVFPEEGN